MSNAGKLTIKPKEENSLYYDITMDGVPIERVTAVRINMEPRAMPTVYLILSPSSVNLELANAKVETLTEGLNDG